MWLENLGAAWLSDTISDPWPIVLPLLSAALMALLYWRGARYEARLGIGRPITRLRAIAFMGGLLMGVLAVASPLDVLADESLAWHMVQHVILTLIVPPLLLFGAPLWPLWRALPLTWRRASLRWLLQRRRMTRIATNAWAIARRPAGAWLLFVCAFGLWHIPPLYDFALQYQAAHAFEHITFLVTALLFWAQVIPSFPLRTELSYLRRAGYLFTCSFAFHLLSILISIAAQPIYTYYGSGSEVVATQTAAGALMDVCGQIVFTVAILSCLWLWLRDEERKTQTQGAYISEAAEPRVSASGALLLAEADLAEPSEARASES